MIFVLVMYCVEWWRDGETPDILHCTSNSVYFLHYYLFPFYHMLPPLTPCFHHYFHLIHANTIMPRLLLTYSLHSFLLSIYLFLLFMFQSAHASLCIILLSSHAIALFPSPPEHFLSIFTLPLSFVLLFHLACPLRLHLLVPKWISKVSGCISRGKGGVQCPYVFPIIFFSDTGSASYH